jgi:hypothetical protein
MTRIPITPVPRATPTDTTGQTPDDLALAYARERADETGQPRLLVVPPGAKPLYDLVTAAETRGGERYRTLFQAAVTELLRKLAGIPYHPKSKFRRGT